MQPPQGKSEFYLGEKLIKPGFWVPPEEHSPNSCYFFLSGKVSIETIHIQNRDHETGVGFEGGRPGGSPGAVTFWLCDPALLSPFLHVKVEETGKFPSCGEDAGDHAHRNLTGGPGT